MTTEKIFDLVTSFVKKYHYNTIEVSYSNSTGMVYIKDSIRNFFSQVIFTFLSKHTDELSFFVDVVDDSLRLVVYPNVK